MITSAQVLTLLQSTNAGDMRVTGVHKLANGLRFETLDTQAGLRIYRALKNYARRDAKVVCGETNNGSGRFFVRITPLASDTPTGQHVCQ